MEQQMRLRLSAIYKRELNGCKRSFEAGNFGAVLAAIRWCRKYNLAAPPWLLDASYELLVKAIRHIKSGKLGRAGNLLARLRQDMIDLTRWDEVERAREKQKEIAKEVAELRKLKNVPSTLMEEQEYMLRWVGSNRDRAYECASHRLQGTGAFAGPDAIRRSYLIVKRASKNSKQAIRYRLIDHYTMERLNLLSVFEPPRGTKPRLLFDPDR